MDYVKQEPFICPTCNTMPMESYGVFSCGCPGKTWPSLAYPGAIRVDAETTTLLAQKGFILVPAANYYFGVGFGDMITVFSNGDWRLDSLEHEQPTVKNLKDYLLSLPERVSPAS